MARKQASKKEEEKKETTVTKGVEKKTNMQAVDQSQYKTRKGKKDLTVQERLQIVDLRNNKKLKVDKIASKFKIGKSAVSRTLKRASDPNMSLGKRKRRDNTKVTKHDRLTVKRILASKDGITNDRLTEEVNQLRGDSLSVSTIKEIKYKYTKQSNKLRAEKSKPKTPPKKETKKAAKKVPAEKAVPEKPASPKQATKKPAATPKSPAKSPSKSPDKKSPPKKETKSNAEKLKVTKAKASPKPKKETKKTKKGGAAEQRTENGKEENVAEPKKVGDKLEIGEPIFDFELETDESTDASPVKVSIGDVLKDYGVVIFFYPKANTGGCTKQATGFRDDYDDYVKKGYKIFGMSADKPKSQASWKQKYDLQYTLLCDPSYEVLTKLGIASGKKIKRSHIVIEKGNKVIDISLGVSPGDSVKIAKDIVLAKV